MFKNFILIYSGKIRYIIRYIIDSFLADLSLITGRQMVLLVFQLTFFIYLLIAGGFPRDLPNFVIISCLILFFVFLFLIECITK